MDSLSLDTLIDNVLNASEYGWIGMSSLDTSSTKSCPGGGPDGIRKDTWHSRRPLRRVRRCPRQHGRRVWFDLDEQKQILRSVVGNADKNSEPPTLLDFFGRRSDSLHPRFSPLHSRIRNITVSAAPTKKQAHLQFIGGCCWPVRCNPS